MVCCIDSNIFIWGLKQKCDSGDEHLRDRAIYLINWITENGHQLLIPTVVLAEVLSNEPIERHEVIMDLCKNAIICDFDQRAALVYASFFVNKFEELKAKSAELGIGKQQMKTDHLIIAIAKSNLANCIYSHDKGVKSFGQKYIDIKELPELPAPKMTQASIFEDLQGRKPYNEEDVENSPF